MLSNIGPEKRPFAGPIERTESEYLKGRISVLIMKGECIRNELMQTLEFVKSEIVYCK